VHKHV